MPMIDRHFLQVARTSDATILGAVRINCSLALVLQ